MLSTVLLPFDGSPAALEAVRHVARGSVAPGRKVLLVNVQSVYIDAEMVHAARPMIDFHRREGEAVLGPAIEILQAAAVDFDAEVVFGPPVPAIVRLARERGCELIVMGTRAPHPMAAIFTRSVASRVVRRSNVPVTLVHYEEGSRNPLPPVRRPPWIAA